MGTATTLLRLGSFTLLTDSNFLHAGEHAYLGYGLFSRRLTDPALRIDELPALDAVLLSHLHGDHFDRRARHGLPRSTPIVTTPQAERRLKMWGFGAADGLATWERHELRRGDERLSITSVPGRHGPGLLDRLLPPVMGSIIDLERSGQRKLRLYVTGDTLYRVFRSPLQHFLGAAARHDLRPAIQTLRRGDTRPLIGAASAGTETRARQGASTGPSRRR